MVADLYGIVQDCDPERTSWTVMTHVLRGLHYGAEHRERDLVGLSSWVVVLHCALQFCDHNLRKIGVWPWPFFMLQEYFVHTLIYHLFLSTNSKFRKLYLSSLRRVQPSLLKSPTKFLMLSAKTTPLSSGLAVQAWLRSSWENHLAPSKFAPVKPAKVEFLFEKFQNLRNRSLR